MKRFIHITFTLSILLLCSACGVGRTPKSTIKGFFNAIEQEKYDKALSHTTVSTESDYELYYAILKKEHDSILSNGGIKKIEIIKQEPSLNNHEHTIITAIIHYNDNSTREECCEMIRVENRWKIVADLNAK